MSTIHVPVSLLAAFLTVCCWVSGVEASIEYYLSKYSQIKATQAQQQKISEYDHLIRYFSSLKFTPKRREVHPDFIRALILAESNGDSLAVSPKKARGLTQIIFTTGKEAAEAITSNPALDLEQLEYVTRTQMEELTPEDLHDPAINIMLACYLISKYNHDYQGQLDLVVSAWNAGAGSIANGQPPEYEETRNLIGKVNGLFRFFIQQS